MSLYSVAKAETGFVIGSNLETLSTEQEHDSHYNVSTTEYGTITQTNSSVTGNKSFAFGANSNVFHQWNSYFSTTNQVMEIVFKRNSTPSSDVVLMCSPGSTIYGDTNKIILQSNGYIRAYLNSGSSTVSVYSTASLCDGKFHHIVWSYNNATGQNARLYVDGILVDSDTTIGGAPGGRKLSLGSNIDNYGTYSAYSEATIDFFAYYFLEIAKTATQMDTFVANHMAAFADRTTIATVSTASALSVEPTLILDSGHSASPATASAAAGDTRVSNYNRPSMLRDYLASLSLEQWFEFDSNIIQNSGSGGTYQATAFGRIGTVTKQIGNGPVGGNSLQLGATAALGSMISNSSASPMLYTTEMSDADFAYGIWFKFPTTLGTNNKEIIKWNGATGSQSSIEIRNKKVYFNVATTAGDHTYTGTADMNDNVWHLAVVRYNHSINTYYYYLDGSQVATGTTTGNRATPTSWRLADGGTTGDTYRFNVADFFISPYSSIDATVISNIWAAGTVPVQAGAGMVQPIVRFNNAYNDYSETLLPVASFRFNASGAPNNFGVEADKFGMDVYGTSYTTGHATKNNFAYRVTNKNTGFAGGYQMSSGQFSDNQLSLSVYGNFGTVSGSDNQIFALMGAFSSANIWINGASSGPQVIFGAAGGGTNWRIINTNDTSLFGGYHLYTATRNGSTGKFYVDGKLIGTSTTLLGTFTDTNSYTIGGYETAYLGAAAATVDKYIDEALIFDYTLSDQQIFELWQSLTIDGPGAVNATFPNPAYSAGFGPTITETAIAVSASMGPVFPPIAPMNSEAMFLNPNYEAIDNTSNAAEPMTASAQAENPGWDIGENNQVLHMDASASMGDARARIPGFWNANPAIANPAEMIMPAFSSTQGARIIAQSMPVQAIFPTPPAYKLITDDIWYSKLYLQHSVVHGEEGYTPGASSAGAFLKLFDDVTSSLSGANTNKLIVNLPRSIIIDDPRNTDTAVQYAIAANEFQTATPTPVLEAGTYDDYERKSVRFRNIQFEATQDTYKGEGGYSLEFTFKSTKANQVIAQGRTRSFYGYQSATSSIGLIDGKLFATRVTQEIGGTKIFAHPDNIGLVSKPSYLTTAYGNKVIADGSWHHVIIQYGFDGRVQFWIDGQLDIQFFADSKYARGATIRPFVLGSNHSNPRWQSDFETSAWSYDAAFFVDSNDITEHYTASIKYEPIHAEPATATVEIGQDAKAAGNRGRALMLYFWPTDAAQTGTAFGKTEYTSTESPDELTTLDYFTKPPQEYEGWDVFPVDITGRWVSDLVKVEAYGGAENIGQTNFIQNVTQSQNTTNAPYALVNKRRTFRDPLTDAPRYIDLINDIDLSKFDMIMFKNYPNDPKEKDAFSGAEVVDAYFNLRESAIFEDFVKSLRAAVDTGISLMVANAQLALDLKIVDRVEIVPDMDDNIGQGNYSDPYAPTQMLDTGAADLPTPPEYNEPLGWRDTWKNNRTRIVNTHPGITDYPALVKTQQAFWYNTDEYRWGGPDRIFAKYEHKNALAVGDEFVISTTGTNANNNSAGYLATPFANVKAGKIITAFANTVRRGLDLIDNPYKNYAQSIIVEPGDVLDGRQVGGRIYVNFTEEINKCQETGSVELTSDYWVNYAYENGAIDLATRDDLLQQEFVTTETPYWSVNGMNLLQQTGAQYELDTNFEKPGVQKQAVKTRKINKNGGLSFQSVPTGGQFFSFTFSWRYPMVNFEVPSMPTRGFRWLSNREVLEGTVIRPEAFAASATMPNATEIVDKVNSFAAQSMVATATIAETNFTTGTTKILVLPAIANATIVKPGSTIGVTPMLANAGMFANSRAKIASEDQVVLQIIHVDPILYIREDVIK